MAKKILIYGVGPFGSLFAERLTEAGHEIAVLDHGERQLELKRLGVVIENTETEKITVTKVRVVDSFDPDAYYDLVIVPMRKNKVIEILPTLAANKKVLTFLFMMNNAEGQERLVSALGQERVVSGFPFPGGYRQGHVIRMLPVDEHHKWTLPIGEVDGRTLPRTLEVKAVLESMRGFKVEIRNDIDDWLKTHVALLVPTLAQAIYACGTDLERFAATRDARVLCVRALREAFEGLRKVGVEITPRGLRAFEVIPEPLLVLMLAKLARSEMFENSLGHLKSVPDEVKKLTDEFYDLIEPAGIETPALDILSRYSYTDKAPFPYGLKEYPLHWKGAYAIAGGAAAAVGIYKWMKK